MAYGEREALTGLITSLIVIVMFFWFLTGQHAAGVYAGADALQLWAWLVMKLVAVSIGIAIAVTVLVHVIYGMITGEKSVDQRDERDREIERTAMTWAHYLLSFGILGVIIDLAFGASAFRAMNVIICLCAASELFKDGLKLWLYRRGT
jgi:hypothetical protein